ncbi:MAG: ribonuclease Y [Candidatus Tectomicrobia bacterium]|nr:ribonuclease Y [Candidatus Tectomicrobia bacterium]
MQLTFMILLAVVALGIGLVIGLGVGRSLIRKRRAELDREAERLRQQTDEEVKRRRHDAELEAKEKLLQTRLAFEEETRERQLELKRMSQRLDEREQTLNQRVTLCEGQEKTLAKQQRQLQGLEESLAGDRTRVDQQLHEAKVKLELIAGMTASEARQSLMDEMLREARLECAEKLRRLERQTRETADRKAREILGYAIQSCASEYVAETTVSVVGLPNEEMKGRIIGREGRNIRALQMATGIDLIVDDTPEAVILSGFDPVKREIARLALERLIADGRIHPARIEEMVARVTKEMSTSLREEGEKAAFEAGVDNLHQEVLRLLGRLRYRTSYSQNMLQHSKEVAYIAGVIAAELGCDVKVAKRAGLLHDIGKAVTHQHDGTHTQISVEILKRGNESKQVLNAIEAHHEDAEAQSLEAIIVQAADAISAARPGARREMLENYIKRLEQLENICDSFAGVQKAYAIQAGREIRVIVEPSEISDAEAQLLARDIAKRIEEEVAYPGEIKVTVIREMRSVEYAR